MLNETSAYPIRGLRKFRMLYLTVGMVLITWLLISILDFLLAPTTSKMLHSFPVYLLPLSTYSLLIRILFIVSLVGIGIYLYKLDMYRLENELRVEHDEMVYSTIPVMMHSVDHEGYLVTVSAHWLRTMGYKYHEVIGLKYTYFMTEASRRYAEEFVLPDFVKKSFCQEVPYQFVKKNGEIIDVLYSSVAVRDEMGHIIRSLAILVDVSERERVEETLWILMMEKERLQKQIEQSAKLATFGEIAIGMAHELNQPLTAIKSFSQRLNSLITKNQIQKENFSRYLGYIEELSQKTANIINELKTFAQTSAHAYTRLDINQVINKALLLFKDSFRAEGIDLILRLEDSLPQVMGNLSQLEEVMVHLINNARDAIMNTLERRVEITSTIIEEQIHVQVIDTGIGMSKDVLEKAFTPFFTTKDATQSVGLGLSLCFKIIQEHLGQIHIQSTPRKGTTVEFSLASISSKNGPR